MMINIASIFLLFLLCGNSMSAGEDGPSIPQCYRSFQTDMGLTVVRMDRLPLAAREKGRMLIMATDSILITCTDGYRIIYADSLRNLSVNVKVEASRYDSYETDKKNILDNMRYLNAQSPSKETQDLIERNVSGYTIWGFGRAKLTPEFMILGSFVMFPGKGIVVYFYFPNTSPGGPTFATIEEYRGFRDRFMEEYAAHLRKYLGE